MTGAEGQGSQAQAQPPRHLPAGRDSTNQAKVSSGKHRRHKRGATIPSMRGPRASDRDPNTAEAEKGIVGGSGISPVFRPPSDAHPVGSELMMLMGPQATRGLEAPPPGPPLPEGASAGTGEEELRGREEVPRRFVHGHWRPGTGLENHNSPAANAKASPKACHLGAALSGQPRPRFRPSAASCCGNVRVFSSEQFPPPRPSAETLSPVPGAGGEDGMDEVTASAHPRTWEPTWDLGKEDLDRGCRRSAGGPRGLCSAGPPRCSLGLHVLGSVARALLWDCPVPAIGQGQAPGIWARGGGAAPGGVGIAGTHRPGERPPAGP
ncbi:hypothetical protein J1605_012874 [Eschrichtius robustus]|uniref:Uncharacterized protein n=1 Tax=Eschrichtius robustus TaxID=9764 RepID=A0AB34GIB4_ESCRO|nr:hypothetical protein J1605_012874 [Eschrichtius robustus]